MSSFFDTLKNHLDNYSKVDEICQTMGLKMTFGKIFFGSNKYFKFNDDLVFLAKFFDTVNESEIYMDQIYSQNGLCFILWPKEPTTAPLQLEHAHGYRNGITILKKYNDHIKFWGFTTNNNYEYAYEYYMNHRDILLYLTNLFNNTCKKLVDLPEIDSMPALPKFNYKTNIIENSMSNESSMLARLTNILSQENKLSNREKDVFRFMCKGYSSKDISRSLNLSTRTVEKHRENINTKLYRFNVREFNEIII